MSSLREHLSGHGKIPSCVHPCVPDREEVEGWFEEESVESESSIHESLGIVVDRETRKKTCLTDEPGSGGDEIATGIEGGGAVSEAVVGDDDGADGVGDGTVVVKGERLTVKYVEVTGGQGIVGVTIVAEVTQVLSWEVLGAEVASGQA